MIRKKDDNTSDKYYTFDGEETLGDDQENKSDKTNDTYNGFNPLVDKDMKILIEVNNIQFLGQGKAQVGKQMIEGIVDHKQYKRQLTLKTKQSFWEEILKNFRQPKGRSPNDSNDVYCIIPTIQGCKRAKGLKSELEIIL